eukprot:s3633_g5.t1
MGQKPPEGGIRQSSLLEILITGLRTQVSKLRIEIFRASDEEACIGGSPPTVPPYLMVEFKGFTISPCTAGKRPTMDLSEARAIVQPTAGQPTPPEPLKLWGLPALDGSNLRRSVSRIFQRAPSVFAIMGNYLTEPKKDKETVMGTGPGLVWGSTGMQGWRTSMEDAHITLPDLGGPLAGIGMYAVFDGHGGKEVAEFCEQHMPAEFLHLAMQSRDILTALKGAFHRLAACLEIRSYRNSQDVGPASSGGNQPSEDLQNSIKDDMADARAKGCITKEASAIRVYAGPV